ncbi:MAG: calcium binding hemolysin protein, partial [Acidimicrobiaceae bacterium]
VIDAGADDDLVSAGAGNDRVAGGSGNDQLQGGSGDDALDGGDGDDVLFGEEGNDSLRGGTGNDYLLGGTGDDVLDGGDGDDVYFYNFSGGNDRIVDSGGNDILIFNDIRWGQIAIGVGSLKLTLPDGGEIHLDDFDPDTPYAAGGIEWFQFADGTVMSKAQLIDALGITPTGTPEADVLSGTALSEAIQALAGDDVVSARAGNDTVDAGDGNDVIYGGDGNDTLHGGTGDDVLLGDGGNDTPLGEAGNDLLLSGGAGSDSLQGGDGDDIYLFQLGDGQDTATDAVGQNAVVLGAGLTLDAIRLSREGNDLWVSVRTTTDRLTVKDWFAADSHFTGLTLADGGVLDRAGVEAALPRNQAPTANPDAIVVAEDVTISASGNALANDNDPDGQALRV